MKANELCPPPHMEAADLDGDTVVTIKGVDFAEVGEEKQRKGVVWFEEFSRSMVINRTNLGRIIEHHGGDTDDWTGKQITLYQSETEYQGKTVDCIRVKRAKP